MPPRALLFLLLVLVCLPLVACSLTPAAVTVGPATVVVRPPDNAVDRYFLDVHEAAHREQFRREGVLRMLGTYVFRPSVRLRLEAEAYSTALCTANRLQAHPRLRARLYDAYVDALRSYVPGSRMSREEARRHLEGAYRGGDGCGHLLRLAGEQPVVPPVVHWLMRQRRSPAVATTALHRPNATPALPEPSTPGSGSTP
jgi:hypothetical protein